MPENRSIQMQSTHFTRRQMLSGLGLAAVAGVTTGTITRAHADEKKNEALRAQSLNVLDFGAARDGVKDDTTAFAAAMKSASDSGNLSVFVPRGRYMISGNRTASRWKEFSPRRPDERTNTAVFSSPQRERATPKANRSSRCAAVRLCAASPFFIPNRK
jgi:hypothetical protein